MLPHRWIVSGHVWKVIIQVSLQKQKPNRTGGLGTSVQCRLQKMQKHTHTMGCLHILVRNPTKIPGKKMLILVDPYLIPLNCHLKDCRPAACRCQDTCVQFRPAMSFFTKMDWSQPQARCFALLSATAVSYGQSHQKQASFC